MTKLSIAYDLTGHGWATVRFVAQDDMCEVAVSYLHDSLSQLADMALELQRGLTESHVMFMDEPSAVQFTVAVQGNTARYEVREFQEASILGAPPQAEYKILMEGTCPLNRIIQQMTTILWKLSEEISSEDYLKRWRHPFPTEKYEALVGSNP